VLVDHREAPPDTDLTDRESLILGLSVAYGDSADVEKCVIHDPPCENPGWVDLDEIANSIWDPDTDIQLARSDWLNQITHATDSWLSQPVWKACEDQTKKVAEFDRIVIGFDGSRGRAKGKPDATALIGCRVNDGHLFEIGVWEAGNIPSHGNKERRARRGRTCRRSSTSRPPSMTRSRSTASTPSTPTPARTGARTSTPGRRAGVTRSNSRPPPTIRSSGG
jgi:hypothetical protein